MRTLILVLTCCLMSSAYAADVKWIGGDGLWSDASRWDGGSLPLESDRAIVAGGVVTLDIDVSVKELLVDGAAAAVRSTPNITLRASTVTVRKGICNLSNVNLNATSVTLTDRALLSLDNSVAVVDNIQASYCDTPGGLQIVNGTLLEISSTLAFTGPVQVRFGTPGTETRIRFTGSKGRITAASKLITPSGTAIIEAAPGCALTLADGMAFEARSGPLRLIAAPSASIFNEARLSAYNEASPILIDGPFDSVGSLEALATGRIRFLTPTPLFESGRLAGGTWRVEQAGRIETPNGFEVLEIGADAALIVRDNGSALDVIRSLRRIDGVLYSQSNSEIRPLDGRLVVNGYWRVELFSKIVVDGDLAGPPPGSAPTTPRGYTKGIFAETYALRPLETPSVHVRGTADLSRLRAISVKGIGGGTLVCGMSFRPLTYGASIGTPEPARFADTCNCTVSSDASGVTSTVTDKADFDRNGIVDDADFLFFVEAYNQGCGCGTYIIANFDGINGMNDADFVRFAAAYDAAICP